MKSLALHSVSKCAVILAGLLFAFKPYHQRETVIKANYDFFTADNFENVYLVKGEELTKYLPAGTFKARYSNLKLGNITNVDATNPLKILVYYRDFQMIVFLDNQLSVNREPLALEKFGCEQAELVCAGANNSFWVYNKQNNELLRFNENSKKTVSTGNLKQVLQAEITPNYMLEHNGFLFLNDPSKGIYVFDPFGTFSKIIPVKELTRFDVEKEIIYYQRENELCSYQHRLFEEACKPISQAKPSGIKYLNKKLFSGYRDSLIIKSF
jgi:hypothetical protein